MGLYKALFPLIRRVDPETAHEAAIRLLATVPVPRAPADEPILSTEAFGRVLLNPLGLAAGFDKHAEVPDACLRLGFGHVEVGGVTPRPQPGNPRPRLFRLTADRGVINRYGLNSQGMEAVAARLSRRSRRGAGLVGVNLGKNKSTADEAADYAALAERLAPFVDYLTVNVSSPNTPGLRDLQGRAAMTGIVRAVSAALDRACGSGWRPALLVKLAPDLDDAGLRDAAAVALDTGLDGLVMGNTTLARPRDLASPEREEAGGLSGRPLRDLATDQLRRLHRLTGGRVLLVGAGGVETGADAYARIRAGATLVQLYSAMVFDGPRIAVRVKRDLAACLARDGFPSVAAAVGVDA